MLNEGQNKLYHVIKDYIPKSVLTKKNRAKTWLYGYNEKYDLVVISQNGTIGQIININGLAIGLPKEPEKLFKRSDKTNEQYWEVKETPNVLKRISTIFQWHEAPSNFKNQWIDYIEEEFNRREQGFWFMNNGVPTYITGTHYMYLQWTKIDVGHPDFREANRIFYIYWEACRADKRSFGMCYLKIRRSGFSFMSSCEGVNTATITKDSRIGILSKTGADAKKMFTDKIVPISNNYPFFFKPIQDGMDKPKTELAYRVPASKLTRKSIQSGQQREELEMIRRHVLYYAPLLVPQRELGQHALNQSTCVRHNLLDLCEFYQYKCELLMRRKDSAQKRCSFFFAFLNNCDYNLQRKRLQCILRDLVTISTGSTRKIADD